MTKRRRRGALQKSATALVGWTVAACLHGAAFGQAPAASGAKTPGSLFTADQAKQGEANYEHYCRVCHGEHLDGGDSGGPPLSGSYFRGQWGARDVAALFVYTKSLMPPDNPGSLTDETYADVLAYVLQYNGYKPGATKLPTDRAAQTKLKLGLSGG